MGAPAPDIVDLRFKLDEGEDDHTLCRRAIAIAERLEYEERLARQSGKLGDMITIEQERQDFDALIYEIRLRRHDHVLDEYDAFIAARDGSDKKGKR